MKLLKILFLGYAIALGSHSAAARNADLSDLEKAVQAHQWGEATQLAHEVPAKDPNSAIARLRAAYALFQHGFSTSALLELAQIKPEQWAQLPQSERKFAEVVILLQKNAPLNLISIRLNQFDPQTSPYLADEIRFNKGREAFERNNAAEAKQWLNQVSLQSRFYAKAHYLLGTLQVKAHDYDGGITEFSRVFDPTAFEQSSEIWRDITTQVSNYFGPKVSVILDPDLIPDSKKVGELAVLGLARAEYARKNYKSALERYEQIHPDSSYYPRATLEKVWTLLSLNQHEEAQKVAMALSVTDNSFEAIEARVARALILVDAGRSEESRQQLDEFEKTLTGVRKGLSDFETTQNLITVLPHFAQTDLRQDHRLDLLSRYETDLETEIRNLRAENEQLFPVFKQYASQLAPLLEEAHNLKHKFIIDHIRQRKADLDRLAVQSRLIRAETFLEDREKLRLEYLSIPAATEEKQLEHDKRLSGLLESAVNVTQPLLDGGNFKGTMRLAFRQSELLWELGDIETILSQVLKDPSKSKLADGYKLRALKDAQALAKEFPNFPQVQFFIGFTQTELGLQAEGLKTLDDYVKRFPEHAHAADAFRILADARFDANEFAAAENYYQHILHFQDSPIVGYALYKIGWCAYNRRDFARTLLGFEQAIVWNNQGGKEKVLSLQRESEHDLVTLFAEVGDTRKAREYFSRFLPGNPNPRLLNLAKQLDSMGQFEKSGELYRLLIASDRANPENVAYEAAILYGFHQLHRWNDVVETAQRMERDYKPLVVQPQATDSAAARAEKILHEAVLAQQYEFKKRPNPEAAKNVSSLDELYFSMYGAWPQSEEPLNLHGHFLLSEKDNAGAATVFEQLWTQFGAGLKEPVREEALRNLIYALNQTEDAKPEGTILSDSAKKIIQFSLVYQQAYPSDQHARAISYLRPAMYFKYHLGSEALKESQLLFEQIPNDEVGQRCFKNMRTTYYQLKNWEQTYNWSSALLQKQNPLLASYVEDLKIIREESYFMWTDQMQDDNLAADRFIKLADDPLAKSLREKSLYNAFVRKNKAGKRKEALEIAARLEKDYPHFENLKNIAAVRAALYQEAGDYERAQPLIESFIKEHDSSVTPAILQEAEFNAGLVAQALGKLSLAQEHFRRAKRNPASMTSTPEKSNVITPPAMKKRLAMLASEFERVPLPFSRDLAKRIQSGGVALEAVAKSYISASTNSKVAPDDALEFFCKVPLLYQTYQESILKLGDSKKLEDSEREELKSELAKVANPIGEKARDFARECLAKSATTEHDGPIFRQVMNQWGWNNDGEKAQVAAIVEALGKTSPWMDGSKPTLTETEILENNYDTHGTEDSWYDLARIRWQQGRFDLTHLTLVDALHKFPNSGRLLNFYAITESKKSERTSALFATAGEKGSKAAWANLALYHFRGARLGPATEALKKAQEAGAFQDQPEVNKLAMEFIKP
jgi:hypothetical protein